MAYTIVDRDNAMAMYLDGRTMVDIENTLKIPIKTLYNWRRRYNWDEYRRVGNISAAKLVEMQLYEMLQDMANNDKLSDPSEVDKVSKLMKVLDRMNPSRQVYNSLYMFLEAITKYVNQSRDPELVSAWRAHMSSISEHLKALFAPKE